MRRTININNDWQFFKCDCPDLIEKVDVPHTWNGLDGQDGGGDYWRGECIYKKNFKVERKDNEEVFIRFNGVNQEAEVVVNGSLVGSHHSGYSAFCFNITPFLKEGRNLITVAVLKWCDGTYLEDQDKIRLSGIFRDVYVLSRPVERIADYRIVTGIDTKRTSAVLSFTPQGADAHVTLSDPDGKVLCEADAPNGKTADLKVSDVLLNAQSFLAGNFAFLERAYQIFKLAAAVNKEVVEFLLLAFFEV